MTVKELQCLLVLVKRSSGTAYYTGSVDGIRGKLTDQALRDAQQDLGLPVTGEVDGEMEQALRRAVASGLPEREEAAAAGGSFWEEIEFFVREEFRCQCGGRYCNGFPAEPKEALVRIADRLRRNLGVPVTVVSGLRCRQHNADVGGVANSQHMYGEAADIYARGISQARVEAELDAIGGVRYHYPIAGSSNVHFDIPAEGR